MTIDPGLVAERVVALRRTIDARSTRPVRLVAVTKRFGADAVEAALAAGVDDIGESYAQELQHKAPTVTGTPRWHFIGHVQTNKVRLVSDLVSLWQSVDSLKLGREIAKRAPRAAVLVQVNASGAAGQSGIEPNAVGPVVEALRNLDLEVRGLMTIGSLHDPDRNPGLFAAVRALADDLELVECSMGMSGDVPEALDAGSTIVRVGTGLFGPRPGA
jgi:pyridoxal phosphate enzyme (YggS family)